MLQKHIIILMLSITFTHAAIGISPSGEKSKRTLEQTEQQMNISNNQPNIVEKATSTVLRYDLKEWERDLLARLVTAEARNEPFEGKIAVAEVVFNRVDSDDFPNTIEEVIYQKNQFQPTRNGAIETAPEEESYEAIEEALNKSNIAQNALFFYNHHTAESRWLDQFPAITTIGNHTFK